MSGVHGWRLVTACSERAGAAVNQVQQGIPLSEVQQQLGHPRIDSATIYNKLANPERPGLADRVAW